MQILIFVKQHPKLLMAIIFAPQKYYYLQNICRFAFFLIRANKMNTQTELSEWILSNIFMFQKTKENGWLEAIAKHVK